MVGKVLRVSFLISGVLLFSSCSAIVNPYSSEFECKTNDYGKCMAVYEAYEKSIKEEKKDDGSVNNTEYNKMKEEYRESLYTTLKSLLDEPKTPVVIPPKVMRVLILPYSEEDEDTLYMNRYIYIYVTKPSWVLEEK